MDPGVIELVKVVLSVIFGASVLPIWKMLFGNFEQSQKAKYNQIRTLQDELKAVQEKSESRLQREIDKLEAQMKDASVLIAQQSNMIAQQASQIAQQAGRISHLERLLAKLGANVDE